MSLLQEGKKTEGFDDDWCAEVRNVSFRHPNTTYQLEANGEVWRFPGQIEYEQISDSARETLSGLIFEHLKAHRDAFFTFKIGRFDRPQRDWDSKGLPTPLGTFVRSKPWIASNTRDGVGFRDPGDCWSAKVRRGPPRFVDRVPDSLAEFADHGDLAEFVFSDAVGLQDWQSEKTAVARLSYLATIARDIASNDRPTYHPAKIELGPKGYSVRPLLWMGAPDLRGLQPADALLVLPPGETRLTSGQSASVVMLC
jgi:hypothetical protein